MGTPFLGEVKIISWNFAPKGWAFCNGQLLPINQNQALFSLFGTMYGGDGRTTFALPDLRGRVPIHIGNGHTEGEKSGAAAHTLTTAQLPIHVHALNGTSTAGSLIIAAGNLHGTSPSQMYQAPDNNLAPMNSASIATVGGSQAHENRQPYLVLNFIVALVGVFPSRN